MKLELYYTETSPYSRKVRVVLLEKGAAFTGIDIRRSPRQARDESPLGKVPLLLVDGVPLYDSVVLTEYLDAIFEEPPLLPKDPYERALVRQFEALGDALGDVLIPVVLDQKRPTNEQNVPLNQALLGKARGTLRLLEDAARGRRYLHGDTFSLADIAVVASIGYVNLRFPRLLDDHADLAHYCEKQLERPSLGQTVPPNLPPL